MKLLHRPAVALVSTVLVAAAVAGCGSDDKSDKPGKDDSSPKASAGASESPGAPIPDAPIVGKGKVVGAKDDLTGSTCEYGDGAWTFVGTLTNTQKSAQVYQVRVSVRNVKTSSVEMAKVFKRKLAAGDTKEIPTADVFESDSDKGLDCIVSVTRTPAK